MSVATEHALCCRGNLKTLCVFREETPFAKPETARPSQHRSPPPGCQTHSVELRERIRFVLAPETTEAEQKEKVA